MKVFLTIVLAVFVSTGVYAQSSATDSFVGKIKVWAPLTLTCAASDMVFPDIVANVAYAADTIISGGPAMIPGGALGNDIDCVVTGQAAKKYTVTLPATPIGFDDAGGKLKINGLSAGGPQFTIGTNFSVEGKLGELLANDVVAGDYVTASQTISIAYTNN